MRFSPEKGWPVAASSWPSMKLKISIPLYSRRFGSYQDFETSRAKLLQILLIGQPQPANRLTLPWCNWNNGSQRSRGCSRSVPKIRLATLPPPQGSRLRRRSPVHDESASDYHGSIARNSAQYQQLVFQRAFAGLRDGSQTN